jgi:hypothetical protein
MRHLPSRCVALLALLLLPLVAFAWSAGCDYGADRRASIDTAGASRVEITARAGDLRVQPASTATLVASGRACASRQAFLDQTLLHVTRDGEVVRVQVQVPEEMKGIGLLYATLDLTVDVPAGLPVDVTDSSGDMTLEGVRIATVRDSSGDIVIRGAAGVHIPLDSSGDIVVERVSRDVRIDRDSSGDITVSGVGGNVAVLADGSGEVRVSAVKGTVQLP